MPTSNPIFEYKTDRGINEDHERHQDGDHRGSDSQTVRREEIAGPGRQDGGRSG